MTALEVAPSSGFRDPASFPFLEGILGELEALRAEARQLLDRLAVREMLLGEPRRQPAGGYTGTWVRCYLTLLGSAIPANRARFPTCARVTDAIPGLVSSALYVLGPGARVEPHRGLHANILRGHVGLVCPEGAALRIQDEIRPWRFGEALVFDDTLEHEAWNASAEPRCVLHFDFAHPADQDAVRLAAQIRELRRTTLFDCPEVHPELHAARFEADPELAATIDETVRRLQTDPVGRLGLSRTRQMVEAHGLVFG